MQHSAYLLVTGEGVRMGDTTKSLVFPNKEGFKKCFPIQNCKELLFIFSKYNEISQLRHEKLSSYVVLWSKLINTLEILNFYCPRKSPSFAEKLGDYRIVELLFEKHLLFTVNS